MLRDPVSITMGLLMLVGLAFVVGLIVKLIRETDLPAAPSEPISHVRPRLTPAGRVLKVGIDCHARACVDDEDRVMCVCGLDEHEAALRGEVTA